MIDMEMSMSVDLAKIAPELLLAGLVLVLLPIGPFLPAGRKQITTWLALAGLLVAGVLSARMVAWPAQTAFLDTYAVDPFAAFFKLFAILSTALVLLATHDHFRGRPHEADVPAVMLLTCLGMIALAAAQDLTLIALAVQLVTVGSYILVGIAKDSRPAIEGAFKLFLFSAVAGVVMMYGMTLLFGLTGTLRLPEMARRLPTAPVLTVLVAMALVIAGYGYKITLAPFHIWVPDTYQGAPTPIAGFLSVGPKAAGVAVLLRTLMVAMPGNLGAWSEIMAGLAALTMTVGNVFALRQTSTKRLLAYSSIGQIGYVLVGVAAASREPLAVPGMLLYLLVYLFMNLGAFFAVEAIEQQIGSDDLNQFGGLGRRLPLASLALTVCLLALAGFPPFGSFVGKAMLFGAAIGAGWTWLAVVMALNTALSLFPYVRVIAPLYLRPAPDRRFVAEPPLLRVALIVLTLGATVSGVLPQPWVAFAHRTADVLGGS